jgi:hypothetical protein
MSQGCRDSSSRFSGKSNYQSNSALSTDHVTTPFTQPRGFQSATAAAGGADARPFNNQAYIDNMQVTPWQQGNDFYKALSNSLQHASLLRRSITG